MDTMTRPVEVVRPTQPVTRRKRRAFPGAMLLQILLGLPLTLVLLVIVILLALPDFVRSDSSGWNRYGD